jgi:hypothetical protein
MSWSVSQRAIGKGPGLHGLDAELLWEEGRILLCFVGLLMEGFDQVTSLLAAFYHVDGVIEC